VFSRPGRGSDCFDAARSIDKRISRDPGRLLPAVGGACAATQVPALVIAVPMFAPSVMAATAISPPMITGISAYSAAAAPESPVMNEIKFLKIFTPDPMVAGNLWVETQVRLKKDAVQLQWCSRKGWLGSERSPKGERFFSVTSPLRACASPPRDLETSMAPPTVRSQDRLTAESKARRASGADATIVCSGPEQAGRAPVKILWRA
jgi:hypothetical protein